MILEGVTITVLGMGIVFVFLIILVLMISGIARIVKKIIPAGEPSTTRLSGDQAAVALAVAAAHTLRKA